MMRRRNTLTTVVFAAVILVGNGASAQGIAGPSRECGWGTSTVRVIDSDELVVEIASARRPCRRALAHAGAAGRWPPYTPT